MIRRCEINILVRYVYERCEKGKLNELITKVSNCLKSVLVLIVESNGGNELDDSDLSIEQLNNINNNNEDI